MIGIILSVFLLSNTLTIDLEQAKQIAIENNPAYGIEELNYRYYKLGLYDELSSNILNPSIGVTYSDVTYEQWPYTSLEGYNFSFSLNQTVFDIQELASIIQSKSSVNSAGASLEEAKNALYYQVEAQYLAVLKAEKLLQMRQNAIKRVEENMRLVSKRQELGQASKLDILNALVSLNRAKLNLSSAGKDYQIAKRLILNILGIWHQTEILLEPVETDNDFELPDLDTLITISLEERPTIKAAREEMKNSNIGFWGSMLSFVPQVSFRWLWNYSSEDFPDNFSTIRDEAVKSSGWSASAGINLFTYPFEVSKMKTIMDMTKLNLLNKRLSVVEDVKEAWLDCMTVYENLNLAQSLYDAAKEGDDLAKLQYELGLISTLELFQSENDLLDAEVTYVSAQYDCKLAKAKIKYVVGGKI